MNDWKRVWSSKDYRDSMMDFDSISVEEGFFKLKQWMGVTKIEGDGPSMNDYISQFEMNLKEMSFSLGQDYVPQSFFDVGCGTGSYLFLLNKMYGKSGVNLGGVDYSEVFIDIARHYIEDSREMYVGEAENLNTDIMYDVVYSRSIFQYFANEEYAKRTVLKMLKKAKHCVAVLDVHDLRLKESFLEYRRSKFDDYDKKYANTMHLFLSRKFFLDLAEENGCGIKFTKNGINNYWNDRFTYDVYMYH